MPRDTLLDFFADVATRPGEYLVYDDGYRSWTYTYREIAAAARRFAARLHTAGLGKGDKVVIWGENRPEWIVALWGCLLRGVIAVPIDYRASAEFLERVARIVEARVVLPGAEVSLPAPPPGAQIWPLADLLTPEARADERGAGTDAAMPPAAVAPDDIAEIIFTSGATAEPKGVVITHRNVLANIVPIEGEIAKYRRWARPFLPVGFLNLLPLSHMFGQAMAAFVPPMLPGTVVFMRGFNPHDIVRQIRTRRLSVLVSVPKILDVLRDHVVRTFPWTAEAPPAGLHWTRRWWRARAVHRAFGLKFWAFVVGAAPLEPLLEEFMSRLGFLVIQGYGLTETAPIVTLNHPFAAQKGSVGKPLHGVEVRIAPDGEILVRGDNVTRGYYRADAETSAAFEDGWLRTGDIGGLDDEGRLFIRGRKKEMIVTADGLNVFPDDVERVLNALPGVRDAAVVGERCGGEERVHAVVIASPGFDERAVLREANAQLAPHQRIRALWRWPGDALPRTEGTAKLRRREIRSWVEAGTSAAPATPADRGETLEAMLARFAHGRDIAPGTTLDELGLSSLDRVELLMAVEERFGITLDESAYAAARTVSDLNALVETTTAADRADWPRAAPHAADAADPVEFPRWNRSPLARAVRGASLPTWILPLARVFAWIRVEGREHLADIRGPVVFAANHQSHMDVPVVLAALPRRLRSRVAIAMAKEFFTAHFFPEQVGRRAWLTNSLNYYLAALFFNAFPIPQREAGTRQTLRYIGSLAADGDSLLIFPEGRRAEHGEIAPFRAGIGMIASKLGLPVVPVRLDGLDHVLHPSWKMARPGRVRVAFGAPMRLQGEEYAALARRVEEAVKAL